MRSFTIKEDDAGRRLDRVVRCLLKKALKNSSISKKCNKSCPLSAIYSAIRKGNVKLNGKKVKPAFLTALDDIISIEDALLEDFLVEDDELKIRHARDKEKESGVPLHNVKYSTKQNNQVSVLLKTDHLLFINKQLGIATHGKDSIDEIVKKQFKGKNSLSFSVAALHRLDKNTTGILTFSQSLQGARLFSKAIRDGMIDRYYLGINEGIVESKQWQISQEILKKCSTKEKYYQEEITTVRLIEYNKTENLSLVLYKLITGKKHQIRKGASYFRTPLFCDKKYGSKRKEYSAYFLHAFALQFKTMFNVFPSIMIAPIPERFIKVIKKRFPDCSQRLETLQEPAFLENILYSQIKNKKI